MPRQDEPDTAFAAASLPPPPPIRIFAAEGCEISQAFSDSGSTNTDRDLRHRCRRLRRYEHHADAFQMNIDRRQPRDEE